jgi:hypothetical protein
VGRLDEALAALGEAAQWRRPIWRLRTHWRGFRERPLPVDSPQPEPASVAAPVAVDDVEETASGPTPSRTARLGTSTASSRISGMRRAGALARTDPEQELAAGVAFYRAGQLDFAVPRLEAASRTPAHRFEAAATLGRIFLERGDTWRAIDWFERAAEASAPTLRPKLIGFSTSSPMRSKGLARSRERWRSVSNCRPRRRLPGRVDTRRPARKSPGPRVALCCGVCSLWHFSSRSACC